MRGVLLYPDRYQKYGTDTRVLDDSTLVCPSTQSGYERSPYLRAAVTGYSCTSVCICTPGTWYMSMSGELSNTPEACSCRVQLYIFGELAEVKIDEPQLEQRRNNRV